MQNVQDVTEIVTTALTAFNPIRNTPPVREPYRKHIIWLKKRTVVKRYNWRRLPCSKQCRLLPHFITPSPVNPNKSEGLSDLTGVRMSTLAYAVGMSTV